MVTISRFSTLLLVCGVAVLFVATPRVLSDQKSPTVEQTVETNAAPAMSEKSTVALDSAKAKYLARDFEGAITLLEDALVDRTVSGERGEYFTLRLAQTQVMAGAGQHDRAAQVFLSWLDKTPSEIVADQFVFWAVRNARGDDLQLALAQHNKNNPAGHKALARLLVGNVQVNLNKIGVNALAVGIKEAAAQVRRSDAELSKKALLELWGFVNNRTGSNNRQVQVARLVFKEMGPAEVDFKFLLTLAVLEEAAANAKAARQALDYAHAVLPENDHNSQARWLWSSARNISFVPELSPGARGVARIGQTGGDQEFTSRFQCD